jgi:REP element-mobilizing transposase RayT
VHVTLRVKRGVDSLRGSAMFRVVRRALTAAKERFGCRLVHFSVQRDHLHLLVEANDRRALSRGLQGLSIRVARAVNRRLGRTGKLFGDRFHARALKTPREAHWAIRYVLLNARKHAREGARPLPSFALQRSNFAPQRPRASPREGARSASQVGGASFGRAREGGAPFYGFVDSRSSAAWFDGWSRPRELCFGAEERHSGEPPVVEARTWLLRTGFLRAGPIDLDDAPA